MHTTTARLTAARIVPVIVIDDAARASDLAHALLAGGITSAEVTLRTPAGLDALAAMATVPGLTVGAGTVLTPEQVQRSADAGAAFIVSPGFDDDVVATTLDRGLAALPGIATATEAMRALRAGLTEVKFFPADRLGGLATIEALAAPLPQLRFMPSGGVGAHNAVEYLSSAAVFAVSGSWMVNRAAIAAGDHDTIRSASAAAIALLEAASADGAL
ncbi:bifunctional 4-hydroxy-2-oxoglutarate aldolase/2-dehydro-3-deoxy-phosphogluconate aldolase [Protaetiibacter larvae]|uniref:2-dehydro-3-deoxy-phosphogluconate aldolase n=1 Tax=Protaetiibacter larvae TaxID=2592654 RepID=A0A5C1Y9F5_9MICO|nr:bifunctional 4-hydroxy-2-oxoglutarate aldolase/2-dehydro-3-deoxy-phosphogluconate aldolase [Protaetiibacter larvae]QEO09537.1 bifunctional 4-hydroxy-2-oxoglutarate aldolase/2-dehydro-3-deoxy-phosphogluconate aldolase [Protaetiibacter larvae]